MWADYLVYISFWGFVVVNGVHYTYAQKDTYNDPYVDLS